MCANLRAVFQPLLLILPLFAAVSMAHAEVKVVEMWSPPSVSLSTGVAYGILQNMGEEDALLRVDARKVASDPELHMHEEEDDILRMRRIMQVPLPKGEPVLFQPGGLHVMLLGLKQPLLDGEQYEAILHFKHHPPVTVHIPISKARLIAHLKSRNTAAQQQ